MPLRARTYIGSSVTSVPSSSTRPESGGVSPTTIENVVVLPAPFGPSRPDDFAGRDIEVDALDDGAAAVGFGEVAVVCSVAIR